MLNTDSDFRLGRQLIRKCTAMLCLGVAIWIVMLVKGALALRDVSDGSYLVSFGPIELTHITRHATSDGVTAGFTFDILFAWYILLWIMAGCGIALAAHRRTTASKR